MQHAAIGFRKWPGLKFATMLALLWILPWRADTVQAAELVMFEAKNCAACRMFNREVGGDYASSAAASILPLRRIDLHDGSTDVALRKPVIMTPTFIFVDKGAEIARIVGYPGRKYFFLLVDAAAEELRKLQASDQTH